MKVRGSVNPKPFPSTAGHWHGDIMWWPKANRPTVAATIVIGDPFLEHPQSGLRGSHDNFIER
jgi:hypothetical protein